jgi:hypothetical protein
MNPATPPPAASDSGPRCSVFFVTPWRRECTVEEEQAEYAKHGRGARSGKEQALVFFVLFPR